jgi:hypothetical protein
MAPTDVTTQAQPSSLWRVGKFALWGSLVLGAVAFAHVWWDGYKPSATGQQPVDDIRYVTVSITALGVIVGAVFGAVAGAVVSIVKWQKARA